MERFIWPQVLGWRLRRLHIGDPSPDLLSTASRLLGVHAQVASSSELITAARTPSYHLGGLDAALWEERGLVKTWGMRGTLHLFPTDELPLLIAALAQRQWPKFTPAWEKYHDVTGDDVHRITEAVGEILPGRFLTREELTDEVGARLKSPELAEAMGSGWGQVLKPAAAGGLLCSGPDRGRNVTFTSPRTWVPEAPWAEQPDADTAMAAVIQRFLDVYGPATHSDFGRWWGTDPASARRLFKQHAEVMMEVDVEGAKAYLTPSGVESLSAAGEQQSGVWLLPGFDPYVIGPLSHRAHTIPDGFVDRVSRTAGWISPVLVVDGVVQGVWSHEVTGGGLVIDIVPFAFVSAAIKEGAAQHAQRYADLFGVEAELRWLKPA